VSKVQVKDVSKSEEPLLSRTLVKANLEFDGSTPSYAEVATALASSLKSDEKLLVIRHVYNHFGAKKADVVAYVYSDEQKKQFIEPKLKVKKDKKAEEKK